jgi:hypothetical protein
MKKGGKIDISNSKGSLLKLLVMSQFCNRVGANKENYSWKNQNSRIATGELLDCCQMLCLSPRSCVS